MGVMGQLLALALVRAGWAVSLFDKGSGEDNCSCAAAGFLTPLSELDQAEQLIFKLGQESLHHAWPKFLDQLRDYPIYFKRAGSLVLSHPRDQAEWTHFSQRITHHLQDRADWFLQVSKSCLWELEPELRKFDTAYYFPEEGQIDCQAFMLAARAYFDRHQISYQLNTPIDSVSPGEITTATGRHRFDMVFDCRGLAATDTFSNLRALRGELIWLQAPEVQLQRPVRLLHPRYRLYVVPRPEQHYLIGASEIEAEDYSPISVRSSLELLTAAYYLHAGFAEARIIKTVTQCRPTLSHHRPCIKHRDGLIAINGLYRHGYLIAPALCEDVMRCLEFQPQSVHYPEIWEPLT